MNIYLLLIVFLIFTVLSFFVFEKDYIHPTFIFNLMFLLSIICAIYNIEVWDINIHNNTTWILVIMAVIFFLCSIVLDYILSKKRNNNINDSKGRICSINIKWWKTLLILIFDIIYIVLMIINIKKIASRFGEFNNFSQALTIFKNNVIYHANAQFPKYLTISAKLIFSFAYVYLFAFINNLLSMEKIRINKDLFKSFVYIIPTFVYCISLLLQSSRGSILRMLIAAVVMFLILYYQKYSKNIKFKLWQVLVIIGSAVFILIGFYYSSKIIGRSTLKKNPVEYITLYGGGSIELFDMYLQDGKKDQKYIGYESFWGIYRFLDDYNIVSFAKKPVGSLEWRKDKNGVTIGNVYTAYRRWINDFGFIGCAIMVLIICILYNFIYNALKSKSFYNKINAYNICLILYSIFFYHLFLISIDCRIFDEIIPASVSQYIILVIVYFLFVANKEKVKIK